MTSRPFVLLDRDGTIIREKNYLSDPDNVELVAGAAEGLKMLRGFGCGLVVITNQSGVGRGYFSNDCLEAIHNRLTALLEAESIRLDRIYVCPHAPEEECACRKPRTALALQASRDLSFDPGSSFVIGDKLCDIEMGKHIGATTILVRTGYGASFAERGTLSPDEIVSDLREAAEAIECRLARRFSGPHMAATNNHRAQRAETHFLESAVVARATWERCSGDILKAASLLTGVFRAGGKLLLCGNGGSAADCQHMAAELVSRLTKDVDRPALPAIALTTDTSCLTACANDDGFDGIFARQIQALGNSGDALIIISTSGASRNVIRALEEAKKRKLRTIALTGNAGTCARLAEVAISVPSGDTQHIQETHGIIEHVLCDLVEYDMFRAAS